MPKPANLAKLNDHDPKDSETSIRSFVESPKRNQSLESDNRLRVKDPKRSFTVLSTYLRRDNVDQNTSAKELYSIDPTQQIDDNLNILSQV